jgi:hypothetical protein
MTTGADALCTAAARNFILSEHVVQYLRRSDELACSVQAMMVDIVNNRNLLTPARFQQRGFAKRQAASVDASSPLGSCPADEVRCVDTAVKARLRGKQHASGLYRQPSAAGSVCASRCKPIKSTGKVSVLDEDRSNFPRGKRGLFLGLTLQVSGRFGAVVCLKDRTVNLGIFVTVEEAARATLQFRRSGKVDKASRTDAAKRAADLRLHKRVGEHNASQIAD